MSSGFITESEALEARKRRQEEWEKVRTPDQPKEAPEEAYDNRPLYHRLEEQRLKKEAEYEEAHKLKNMIRGLDDDEVGFLDLVEETKLKQAQQISMEDKKEMQEFRDRVSTLAETEEMLRLRAELAAPVPKVQPSQQKNKLQGVIVRKRKASEVDDEKSKDVPAAKINGVKQISNNQGSVDSKAASEAGIKCVGVLPGMGHYDTESSSDSESSDSESDKSCTKLDLLGRAADVKKDSESKS